MVTKTPQFSENIPLEMDFDQPAINIGSHPGNDIVLKGAGVRPFHVSLVLQDGDCQVLPLEANAEVRLDGKPVQTAQFKLAGAAHRLDVGENTLLLEYNQTFDGLHVRINPTTSSAASTESKPKGATQGVPAASPAESPILLNLFSQTDEVEAGQTATYELEIVNAGALVASFKVLVEGAPKEWVSISPEEINLYEGQHKPVHINITPPRQPDSAAGQHELRVGVFSANYPGQQAAVPVFLRIKPYYEFMLGNLSPREQKSSWRKRLANTSLPITNRGNCPADFAVLASDDENGCSFDFVLDDGLRLNRQAAVPVPAGQTLPLPIEISPHKRRWINGKRYSYTTTVQVTNQPVAPQMVSGSLSCRSLFPWWGILLVLFAVLVGIFIMLQPNINYFQVAANKDIIELGDTTKLEWSVWPFANRISISNNLQPLNDGQTSLTVAPTQPTTYELTAGNWLSGLLNMDRRESRTVLVVPPSPVINAFAVDNTRVAQGKSVKIRWSVTQADQAFLTVDDVISELPKEQFSGEKDVVLTKDALVTLEAKSAGGQALRSYFVNVDEPKITVTTYTVWVKSASKTGLPIKNGVAKRAATPQSPPDPNFPDKYVELVPDATSDNGYKVSFYQVDRELAKGEQVLVEWDVAGADNNKVQIAPFTDTLPAKGSQPFFPTESMNFVLTAKSGVLEKIFMLPVKVFNGSPPTAPKIEFFQGVPVSMVGAGDVQFSWSVSGPWTRVQLMTGETIIADYLNPQGVKTLKVSKSGTYILTAWNGDLSSAKPLDITVNPTLKTVNLAITGIYPNSDQFLVGNKITVSVKISSQESSDDPFPTGDITITDGVATCSITLPALSCDLTFKSAGDKQLWASYGGDTIYSQGTSSKYPSNKKIHVSSPTVKLTPDFYLTGAMNNPIVITNQQFKMDQKLYVKITIAPSGAVLPDDQKSKVSLSICRQSDYPASCSVPTATTVAVNTDGTGTADILISSFPGAGIYVLRFDYRHDDNLLTPASYNQGDVKVSKLGIYLTLPPSCSDLIPDGAICSFGYTNPQQAQILFDIHQTAGNDYLDESMPKPTLTFKKNEVWRVYDVSSGKSFGCEVKTRSVVQGSSTRTVFVLKCVVNVVGKANLSVNYTYDNNIAPDYFMGSAPTVSFGRKPFFLRPAGQTIIQFNASNYSVGQIISLTPNAGLRLLDVNTNRPITNVIGKITFSSNSQNAAGLFGVVPGSTCSANTDGSAIVNIDIDEKCQVFFRKAGTWDVQIDFTGDDNYAASSASVAGIKVAKLSQITTTWFYSSNDAVNPVTLWENMAIVKNQNQTIPVSLRGKIVFNIPAGFSGKVLDGETLHLTSDPAECLLSPQDPIEITYKTSSQQAVLDFAVACTKFPVKVELDAVGFSNPDFELVSATRQATFINQDNVGGVYFEITRESQAGYFNFDWSTNNLPRKIPLLFAGETYTIHLMYQPIWIDKQQIGGSTYCSGKTTHCQTIDDLLDFIQYDDKSSYRAINVTFPPDWSNKIDSVSGGCSLSNGRLSIPLVFRRYFTKASPLFTPVELSSPGMMIGTDESYTPSNKYTFDNTNVNPCVVRFGFSTENTQAKLPLDAGGAANFSLSQDFTEPTTGGFITYSADENYVVKGLTKSFVKAVLNQPFKTKVPVGSPLQTVTMTLTNPDYGTTARPPLTDATLANWFDVGYPPCMGLTGLTGKVISVGTATSIVKWTMTPSSSYPCTGTLSIHYKENTYFGRQPLVSQTVQFAKRPVTATPTPAGP